ncbi:helix-turn-helix domain-containing protein [Streptomyces sp. NPDC057623]|uniref:helix-turn-helix domain-containing protein n=1 Tax=Streptomyces sp. NPDC057623 TaxID=3346187 RepID=UPI0036742B89
MAERIRVREIDDDEGQRLLRIIRRGTGSVVTWRRAQMVLPSAQGMPEAKIAEVTFTSADRVRDVIHNFNADSFDSLYPRYKGGRPKVFTLPERCEIKKIAKSKPVEHGLPFSTWSLAKLAGFLVAEGVVDDISHEGLRVLLREEGVSFQRIKTWKTSHDPVYAARKARVEHLYAIADGEVIPEEDEPEVIFCLDEFGPLNLQPHPGRQWAERGGKHKDSEREPRPRRRATHLTTKKDSRVGEWAAASNVEFAYTPTNSSWLNRIEAQFTALRYFTLDGTDHASHKEQGSMIRRYIIWRNKHSADELLREVAARANVA